MKLYLSSYRLSNNPEELVKLIGSNKKIAIIANSMDFLADDGERKRSVQREFNDLIKLGLDPEEIDLRDFFGKPDALERKMSGFGALWVRGGNTFVLRRAFAQSGFDKWLMSQKDNKELVYAGYSAGVCVLSPSLKGSDITDDPNIVPKGYNPEIIWDGLGLIDFAFAPHYKSDHRESASMDKEVEYYTKNNIPFRPLHDGEVIVMET